MNNYYNKLINRNKLKKFWSFLGSDSKKAFPINYKFIWCFYKNRTFFDFNVCMIGFKKIFPIFNSIFSNNGDFLFIGTSYIYSSSIHNVNSILQLRSGRVGGILTNFSLYGYNNFNLLSANKVPSVILFFNTFENYFAVLEAKKKNVPTIGLIHNSFNSFLIDYPILLNPLYFYNIYIFSRFFFKYIIKLL